MANSTRRNFAAAISMLVTLLATLPIASAEPATSYARVSKVYSRMDGGDQAIELELVSVKATPLSLGGKVLTVRDKKGSVRLAQTLNGTFDGPILRPNLLLATFADDNWNGIPLANADILIDPPVPRITAAQPSPYAWHIARIPLDGGTIEIEGMDSWTFGPLPLSGMHALARDGSVVESILQRYTKSPYDDSETTIVDWATVTAIEYYHEGMDHYFLTALQSEIELLETGQIPGWKRTGVQVGVLTRPNNAISGSVPICRLLRDYPGGYSHILSSVPDECALLADDSSYTLESAAVFHAIPVDPVTGGCSKTIWIDLPLQGTQYGSTRSAGYPVYRFWNGMANANHRYVTSYAQRTEMVEKGWISEGYGSDGLAFCNNQ